MDFTVSDDQKNVVKGFVLLGPHILSHLVENVGEVGRST